MKEFQVVISKLQGKARADEEALTDLLNERERTGWRLHSQTALSPTRLLSVFAREA